MTTHVCTRIQIFTLTFLAFLLMSCTSSQTMVRERPDPVLQQKLESIVHDFKGDIGIFVRHLRTGQMATIQADTLFPTASMIKVPILCTIFSKINKGELGYDQILLNRDSLKYDDGVSGSFRDSTKIPLSELVMLMITLSDNTASLWLQQLAGMGATINAWLEQNGFHNTRVNSRTPGRRLNWEVHGWGQTTPREMADLLLMIYQGRAVSPDASEEMYRVLTKPYWDGEALSQFPPTIHAASKSGSVNASKSEVVLVNGPSGDYVFCVIVKNQQNKGAEYDNDGYVLIREVSRALWQHFEPDSKWRPQPSARKWAKPDW
ncbi:MAG: class A beta-lactamase-related serine hydrolase [Ignavibacteriales bacterium]|nr:class A beta-lactamase-related serine hydrolase [Ignavibacteriales bacterium]